MISLVPVGHADAAALLAFELAHREFFERTINARPPAYYAAEGVARAIGDALDDAANDRGYQFLIRADAGEIVGRINLSGVRRAHFHSAALGYRIAESHCGKGYASEALRQVVDIAFSELGLLRIEADARADNAGSIRVLLRNGFVQFGHSKRSFQVQGVWYDRLHFERHADRSEEA